MLPRDRSDTTSLKSSTSKAPARSTAKPAVPAKRALGTDTPVQFVKGVGPRLGSVFESRGISTVRDLLMFFPRAYEDRSLFLKIAELEEGVTATVAIQVLTARRIPLRTGKSIFEVRG